MTTSCTVVIAIGDTEYQVSGYKIGKTNKSQVFRCPTPRILWDPKNDKNETDHPRDGKEYEVDATLWLTPAPRDDIIVV